jgi:hypothetical protein
MYLNSFRNIAFRSRTEMAFPANSLARRVAAKDPEYLIKGAHLYVLCRAGVQVKIRVMGQVDLFPLFIVQRINSSD